jgi:predicted enzyme related to lactoylglutathione lyase
MATFDGYPAGTPAWVDLGTPDMEAASHFYGGLFGWDMVDQGPDAGGYAMFMLRGKAVAGAGPLMSEHQPPAWSTYIFVDDADATVAAAQAAGGTVIMPPMDVLDAGRMAILQDPTGAFVSLWQPRNHKGAELANEPNTLCWSELNTRDLDGAITFYAKVFGWDADTTTADGMTYTEWKVAGRSIGGMMEMNEGYPAEAPANWLTYFAVDDCDDAVARAVELGGATLVPAMDVPPGRLAVLADPQLAVFAVIKMSS